MNSLDFILPNELFTAFERVLDDWRVYFGADAATSLRQLAGLVSDGI